ncbi:DNA breaking-rejoining enzyme [Favolaschia claudopus]|uniref:DNA breaking-rejoining enzyme n=1 Tax=Favolaschia claudopus TaxID=2862362 RepID=A0AAW0DNU6_9AGAR
MSVLDKPQFAGVLGAIRPTPVSLSFDDDDSSDDEVPAQDEIQDDIEGEQQTITFNDDSVPVLGSAVNNEEEDSGEEDETHKEDRDGDVKMDDLRAVIKEFVCAAGFIDKGKEFFTSTPDPQSAIYIVAWIMNSCDDIGLDGKTKDAPADSYNHAQKMRAACTYGFGRLNGLGSIPWQKSEFSGKMIGNPSISEDVSRYMVSLRKKKVRAGEIATSARAITPEILAALYHYNNLPEVREIKPVTRRKRTEPVDPNQWGGGRSRLMLHAVYVIAFLCLLRFDEALKIQLQDIRRINEHSFELTLPFRKTSQYGEIKPFVLHEFPPEQAHLCPVRALTAWLACARITQGYLFPTITIRDQVGDSTRPMKSEKFLEMFRNNLLDIGMDPYPYGTHSFRRGGCQYFASHRRWSLRRICDWGGWSMEFSSLTIVKYLIGWNDDPTELRENFLNPNQKPTEKCAVCGRTCACGR